MTQKLIKGVANNLKVIHENLNNVLNNIRGYRYHTLLEDGQCITEPKMHPLEGKRPIRKSKCGLLLTLHGN